MCNFAGTFYSHNCFSKNMTITLLQQDIVWGDPIANQKAAETAIMGAPKSDIYVLPEMWSTGFMTDPLKAPPQTARDSALQWMQMMADRTDAAIAGSIATTEASQSFNRLHFVTPSTATEGSCFYDKRHLFTYSGEHLHYTAGKRRVVVEWRGVRFLLQVCYDLRFPVFSRNRAEGAEAYDVALYVASWPMSRRGAWDVLLRARAIENQCYVCAVNRTGSDPACEYNGGTVVIDAYGRTVAACPDGTVDSVTAVLDMDRLRAFRKKFPVLEDADCQLTVNS